MNPLFASINLEIVPVQEAKLSIQDLSIQRGFGIFDFLKIVDGKPIFLNNHIDRFYNSAKEMYMEVLIDKEGLTQHILKLVEVNNMPDAGLKFILTGGYSEDGYTLSQPNLVIAQNYFKMERSLVSNPLRLMSYEHQRQVPTVKTIDYLQAIRLQPSLKSRNLDDIIYLHQGLVRECPRANIFMVKENEVITPKNEILAGITRSKILNLKLEGYTIKTKDFTYDELLKADEVFISSSTKNATAVSHIDDIQIGNGQVGPITSRINNQLWDLILQETKA